MRPTSAFVSGLATMGVLAGGVFIGTGVFSDNQGGATASGANDSGSSNGQGSGSAGSGGGSSASGGSSSNGGSTATNGSTQSGSGKDGVFDGQVVQTRYGPMQVEITIKNGQIVDATALQHPGSDPTSTQINSQVVPILTKATLDYQTVHFGNVSRATISSDAYKQSAQSALDQAGFTG